MLGATLGFELQQVSMQAELRDGPDRGGHVVVDSLHERGEGDLLAAEHGDDKASYLEGKSAFLRGILDRIGLSRAELDGIESANRRPDA